MAHFGILIPPTQGHLLPFLALSRTLMQRNHRLTVFGIADLQKSVERAGVGFRAIGEAAFPVGSSQRFQQAMNRFSGLEAMLHWNDHNVQTARTLAPELLDCLPQAGLDGLLIDQIDLLGASIAEALSLPFVTICVAEPFNWEPTIPPTFVDFEYNPTAYGESMYGMMMKRILRDFNPVIDCIQTFRQEQGLAPYDPMTCLYPVSPLAQIAQLPQFLDLPRQALPDSFLYAGPFAHPHETAIAFPYERLDGRPLVYASMGTLVNGKYALLRSIAEACAAMGFQAVMPIGMGGDVAEFADLPGNPVVVEFAPQRDLLRQSHLLITHAGLNTVLDGIRAGVPMVAIPISLDQPGTATRVKWAGLGEVVSYRRASTATILAAMQTVCTQPAYRERALHWQSAMNQLDGATTAADRIEAALVTNARPTLMDVVIADEEPSFV
ncbi:glycosyltransferase [Spirosoma sordidisoli]|uniref:Glycosyl transferase family 1 n=1 Tax=Spirosoma sordidisoli TaxID=2502893 RepID=A0A4Q2UH24_9BACT|nr:nucleotide disphospho-sugar-binding domain-containing protein [Spirosoma sordidisoli]RYC68464.1 glycosyl transferase family 1 [Spirosoma sordidisoli]